MARNSGRNMYEELDFKRNDVLKVLKERFLKLTLSSDRDYLSHVAALLLTYLREDRLRDLVIDPEAAFGDDPSLHDFLTEAFAEIEGFSRDKEEMNCFVIQFAWWLVDKVRTSYQLELLALEMRYREKHLQLGVSEP